MSPIFAGTVWATLGGFSGLLASSIGAVDGGAAIPLAGTGASLAATIYVVSLFLKDRREDRADEREFAKLREERLHEISSEARNYSTTREERLIEAIREDTHAKRALVEALGAQRELQRELMRRFGMGDPDRQGG
jgi:phage protein D